MEGHVDPLPFIVSSLKARHALLRQQAQVAAGAILEPISQIELDECCALISGGAIPTPISISATVLSTSA